MQFYKGWVYGDNGPNYHPVTGRWWARRYGVELSANTEEQLKTMIDNRITEYPKTQGV